MSQICTTSAHPDRPALPFDFRFFESLDSTSDEAKRLGEAGSPGDIAIIAVAQSRGRGRQGRRWASPQGNLYLSLLLRPPQPVRVLGQLGFVASIAVVEAVTGLVPALAAGLKWPNDVLVGGAKLAGVLVETRLSVTQENRVDWLALGIGVNVMTAPMEGATCLRELGCAADANCLAGDVLAAFSRWRETWELQGFAPIRREWLLRAHRPGQELRVRQPGGYRLGYFRDLDHDGALLLDTSSGPLRIVVGDLVPV